MAETSGNGSKASKDKSNKNSSGESQIKQRENSLFEFKEVPYGSYQVGLGKSIRLMEDYFPEQKSEFNSIIEDQEDNYTVYSGHKDTFY